MRRRLTWGRRALDDFDRIARQDDRQAIRIRDAVARYADDDQGDVRKMAGRSDLYRLRVGDWRVVYRLLKDERVVLVVRLGHRSEVYDE